MTFRLRHGAGVAGLRPLAGLALRGFAPGCLGSLAFGEPTVASPVSAPVTTSTAPAISAEDGSVSAVGDAIWHSDFRRAVELARASGKHTLLLFTGLGWEEWSRRLQAEVLARADFVSALAGEFVLTHIDLPENPRPKAELSPLETRHYALAGEFGLHVFPSLYLCTPEGRPYGLVGYREGGAEVMLEDIAAKRAAYVALTARIEAQEGPERARSIDLWLETLPEPLRVLHADKIDLLIEADPEDVTGLRTKYQSARTLPEARRLRYAGRLDESEKLYRELIAETPAPGEQLQILHYELGDVYLQKKDYGALLDTLDQAIAAAPGSPRMTVLDEMMEVFTRQWIWTLHDGGAMRAAGYDHKRMRLSPDGAAPFARLIAEARTVAPASRRNRVLAPSPSPGPVASSATR